ncbi:hypothetical protein D8674_023024 [Pyrus ussuriensis x Pyrus communis]|uniref:Uncharacterized protein n=1 Tax=Pyrus ussuriensis x Pyrus communis TaxID=2448454 RepID=A0A5N5GLJ8_9ROSA|nr:hypothetical protein D8674_023024 [Pyrus ussuriensis x Pyrus communis]
MHRMAAKQRTEEAIEAAEMGNQNGRQESSGESAEKERRAWYWYFFGVKIIVQRRAIEYLVELLQQKCLKA